MSVVSITEASEEKNDAFGHRFGPNIAINIKIGGSVSGACSNLNAESYETMTQTG